MMRRHPARRPFGPTKMERRVERPSGAGERGGVGGASGEPSSLVPFISISHEFIRGDDNWPLPRDDSVSPVCRWRDTTQNIDGAILHTRTIWEPAGYCRRNIADVPGAMHLV